jgi:hypothetical protein
MHAGEFHDFHQAWIVGIHKQLNCGGLPNGYYALIEMPSATTESEIFDAIFPDDRLDDFGCPLAISDEDERQIYALRKNILGVFSEKDERQVARIEAVVPGNKSTRQGYRKLLRNITRGWARGLNLVILDVLPPTIFAPRNLHLVVASELVGVDQPSLVAKPLTFASYSSGEPVRADVSTCGAGDPMPRVMLPLGPDRKVSLDIDSAYEWAIRGMSRHLRRKLDSDARSTVS